MNNSANLIEDDLDNVLALVSKDIDFFRGKRLFITGGTGFLGRWLLESLHYAEQKLGLGLFVTVLSRNPRRFASLAPHLAGAPQFQLLQGNVCDFVFYENRYDYFIHAAAEAGGCEGENTLYTIDTIVAGTRRVLDYARFCKAKSFLMVSSGAIYGKQPSELLQLSEEFTGGPDVSSPKSAYGEGKRLAETMCSIYAAEGGLEIKIARCFAFMGPFMPLAGHFAAGNFVNDVLSGRSIKLKGDGTALRSYMYPSDLVVWFIKILLHGKSGRSYNVGSDNSVSIRQLAEKIASFVVPAVPVEVSQTPLPGNFTERYVPDISRAQKELELKQTVGLDEAIAKTLAWYRQIGLPGVSKF